MAGVVGRGRARGGASARGDRSLRRWRIRARLRQNLDLASAVREHGSSAELDPVLTELITDNLIELAPTGGAPAAGRPDHAAWKAIQVVSVIGWAFAAVLAVRSTAGLAHNVGGLIVFALAVDVPLLFLAIVGRDLVRRRLRRGRGRNPYRRRSRWPSRRTTWPRSSPRRWRWAGARRCGRSCSTGPTSVRSGAWGGPRSHRPSSRQLCLQESFQSKSA
jgi:hypothetical protein